MKKIAANIAIIFVVICSIFILIKLIFHVDIPFIKLGYRNKTISEFSIGIYAGSDPFSFHEIKGVKNPVLTAADVSDVDAMGVADPFMVHHENQWYMFFEIIANNSGHGDIGYSTSANGLDWKYQRVVLNEPFHLSYPYVFLHDGTFYMIPETHEAKSVRLYRAKNFPVEWQLDSVLLSGLNYSDSSILKFDDKWWLFIETAAQGFGTLSLYIADDLHGPWHEHPKSPVIERNENIARPGGRMIIYDNALLRFTQDCTPTYGNQLRVFQIDKLTPDEYIEHEHSRSPVLESGKSYDSDTRLANWRSAGMHHIDPHENGNGNWIACVDGSRKTVKSGQLVFSIDLPIYKQY